MACGVPCGTSESPEVDFRFHDIRFSVEVSKARAAVIGGKHGEKKILKGVSGAVDSGQILAIIGASGAGKTSLLDILVGKVGAAATTGMSARKVVMQMSYTKKNWLTSRVNFRACVDSWPIQQYVFFSLKGKDDVGVSNQANVSVLF